MATGKDKSSEEQRAEAIRLRKSRHPAHIATAKRSVAEAEKSRMVEYLSAINRDLAELQKLDLQAVVAGLPSAQSARLLADQCYRNARTLEAFAEALKK